jgi:hypothetical protein
MRVQSRLVLGLYGLALAFPAWVVAAPPDDNEAAAASVVPPHRHKGLFGWRHCVECQRAYVKSHDGIDIPPPPALGPQAGMHGQVVALQPGNCTVCEGMPVGPGMVVSGDPHAPGYAMVGGPGMMQDAPGYAVVGEAAPGAGPSPIGVSRGQQVAWANGAMAARGMQGGAGPYDPAVVPTSIPPAQVALEGPGHDRPHIISHLFGLPIVGHHRREREEKAREKHASIAYDQPNRQVTELPASLVYGKNNH